MIHRKSQLSMVLIGCLFATIGCWAGELPDYYPVAFRVWGVLQRLDIKNGHAVVNDLNVRFTPQLKVYTPSTRFGTVQTLREGMKVGFMPAGDASGMIWTTTFWVLPDDYTSRRH